MNTQTRWFLILGNISFLSTLFWFLWWCQSGIEFGDEGFYLNWMKNPWEYSSSISQFGFVYHPLFTALGESIVLARITNILITFVLSFFLSFLLLKRFSIPLFLPDKNRALVISFLCFGFSLPCLAVFFEWNGTPSYNTLTFQGMILATISILLIETIREKHKLLGWVLLSVSVFLVFLGKPSTAGLFAPITLGYLFFQKQINVKGFLISISALVFLFFCLAIWIDGSVPLFLKRYQDGLALMAIQGSHESSIFFRGGITFWRSMGFWVKNLFWFFLFLNITYLFLQPLKSKSHWKLIIILALALSPLMAITAQTWGPVKTKDFFGFFQITTHYIELFYFVFFLIGVFYFLCFFTKKKPRTVANSPLPLSLYFLVLPYVFAFGTNRDYWLNGGLASLFWVLGGVSLLLPTVNSWKQLLCFLFSLQCVVVMISQRGLYHPFRQTTPLFTNNQVPRNINIAGFPKLSEPVAQYLEEIKSLADRSGFQEKEPIIDLTGHSPTTVFFLGGRAIGAAWFMGSFPGSQEVAYRSLKHVSCETLSTSWVLVEKEGIFNLPPSIMDKFGLPFAKVFTDVGKVFHPLEVSGLSRPGWQTLFRPRLTEKEIEELCQKRQMGLRDQKAG